jgi:anti-sigma-K factor RskA
MKLENYISSGILEAYVLDQLGDDERRDVEQKIKEYPEIRQELSQIEDTLESLSHQFSEEPGANLKKELLEDVGESDSRNVLLDRIYRLAIAASITVAIASVLIAFNYRSLWMNSEQQLAEYQTEQQVIADNLTKARQELDQQRMAYEILSDESYQRIRLKGTENAPDANALVYWNTKTNQAYFSGKNLKALTQDQQYQLWAIIDGKPVSAGVIDPSALQFSEMDTFAGKPSAFAITIEPKGGSENPTLETMQVMGAV